jgi:hypothetical protein
MSRVGIDSGEKRSLGRTLISEKEEAARTQYKSQRTIFTGQEYL